MIPSTLALGGVFAASILGSVHCAAMCGPFGGLLAALPGNRIQVHAAYHLGRLAAYATLSLVLHAAGNSIRALFIHLGLPQGATYLFAGFLALWALFLLVPPLRLPGGPGRLLRRITTSWSRLLTRLQRPLLGRSPVISGAAVGATTGLLPCLWLYAFLTAAAAQPTLARTYLVLVLFWAGNIPWLVASQSLLHLAHGGLARWSRGIATAFLAALMLFASYRSLPRAGKAERMWGQEIAADAAAPADTSLQCCHKGGAEGDGSPKPQPAGIFAKKRPQAEGAEQGEGTSSGKAFQTGDADMPSTRPAVTPAH